MAVKIDRLGETRMMNCGMEATIIRYGTCADIDVRFEDGTVAVHKTYNAFKKGEIANQNIKASRLGETPHDELWYGSDNYSIWKSHRYRCAF